MPIGHGICSTVESLSCNTQMDTSMHLERPAPKARQRKRECLWCRNGFDVLEDASGIRYHEKPGGVPTICASFGRGFKRKS